MIEYTMFPETMEKKPLSDLERRILNSARRYIDSGEKLYYVCNAIQYTKLTLTDEIRSWMLMSRYFLKLRISASLGSHNTVDSWYSLKYRMIYGKAPSLGENRLFERREYRNQWIDKILERGYI